MTIGSTRRPAEAWRSPQHQICFGVNAPAAVLSAFLRQGDYAISPQPTHFEYLLFSYGLYFILIAMLWYVVTVEITKIASKGNSLGPLTYVRAGIDLTLLACACLLIFMGMMNLTLDVGSARWQENPSSVGCLLWGIAITLFSARDLYLRATWRESLPLR
jgi:hypothetical protein